MLLFWDVRKKLKILEREISLATNFYFLTSETLRFMFNWVKGNGILVFS